MKFDSLNYARVKEFKWQADMKQPRFCLSLAKTSKNMAVTGGDGGNEYSSKPSKAAELFFFDNNIFKDLPDLQRSRMAHASVMMSQVIIYVFAGLQDKDRYALKIERLEVSREGTWKEFDAQGIFRPDFPIQAVNYGATQTKYSFLIFGKGLQRTYLQQKVTIDEGKREEEKDFELLRGLNLEIENYNDDSRLNVLFTNYERIQTVFQDNLFAVDVENYDLWSWREGQMWEERQNLRNAFTQAELDEIDNVEEPQSRCDIF